MGAGYLVYLGIRALLHTSAGAEEVRPRSLYRLFIDGVVVSVFNPKIAIFFLAFLPQFVDERRGPVPQQVFLLGVLYVALALVTDGAYALLASRLRNWLGAAVVQGPLLRYISGAVYRTLGASALFTRRN